MLNPSFRRKSLKILKLNRATDLHLLALLGTAAVSPDLVRCAEKHIDEQPNSNGPAFIGLVECAIFSICYAPQMFIAGAGIAFLDLVYISFHPISYTTFKPIAHLF